MAKVIKAQVYFRDSCNPDAPSDCAPILQIEGAVEFAELVSEHGIAIEELPTAQENNLEYVVPEAGEKPQTEPDIGYQVDGPEVPLS